MKAGSLGLLAILVLAGGSTPTSEVEIIVVEQVEAARDDVAPDDASNMATLALSRLPQRTEQRAISFSISEPLELTLPSGSSWEVTVGWDGHWVPAKVLNVQSVEERFVFEAWPMGRLSGDARWSGLFLPAHGDLVVATERLPLGQRNLDAPPPARFPCTVSARDGDRRGAFECEVPAGTHDLGFYLDDHAPVYRWATRIPVDETTAMGRLTFTEGASLSGWIVSDEGLKRPVQDAARLVPRLAPGPRSSTSERLERAAPTTTVDQRGFFQFKGLAAGDYALEITVPGYGKATVAGIVLHSGEETRLDQLVELAPPVELGFSFEPSVDWKGEPWVVEVRREDQDPRVEQDFVYRGPLDADGRVKLRGQSPGPYSVRVFDSSGDLFLVEPQVLVFDRDTARRTFVLDIVAIEGVLRHGDRPATGRIWFGGRYGAPRVEVDTDEDGRFEAVLPRDGRWPVDVETALPPSNGGFDEAQDGMLQAKLTTRVDDGEKVELRIPDTVVFGWVVDPDGRPVEDATVTAVVGVLANRSSTGTDGAFTVRGLPEGELVLSARHGSQKTGERATQPRAFTLDEGFPVGPIRLTLETEREVSGVVRDRGGPVTGATVYLFGHVPALSYVGIGRSDADGRFTLRVPESAHQLRALILAPGRGLQTELVDPSGGDLVFDMERWAGTIAVKLDREWQDLYDEQQIVLLFQDGLPIPTNYLAEWGLAQGAEFLRPDGFHVLGMAPGAYELCRGPMGVIEPAALEEWKLRSECAAGELTGGGALRLDLASADQ